MTRLSLSGLLNHSVNSLSKNRLRHFTVYVTYVQGNSICVFSRPSDCLSIGRHLATTHTVHSLLHRSACIVIIRRSLDILSCLSSCIYVLCKIPSMCNIIAVPFNIHRNVGVFLSKIIPARGVHFHSRTLAFHVVRATSRHPRTSVRHHCTCPDVAGACSGRFGVAITPNTFASSRVVIVLNRGNANGAAFVHVLTNVRGPSSSSLRVPRLGIDCGPRGLIKHARRAIHRLFLRGVQSV